MNVPFAIAGTLALLGAPGADAPSRAARQDPLDYHPRP
jgi:hypothetical protein